MHQAKKVDPLEGALWQAALLVLLVAEAVIIDVSFRRVQQDQNVDVER